MADKQRKFYPISSWVPDPPAARDSGLEACSGVVPFNGGMLAVSGRKTLLSNVGSPLLDEDGDILTDEDGAVLNAENFTNEPNNSLHIHYARGKDETDTDKIKYYFNIADLFIGQWDAIYKVGDVLNQMGAQDILDVTNQDDGPYGVGGSTNLYLDPVPWSFASFGWNKVIATNYSDPIQRYVYGAANDYFESFLAGGATSIRAKFVCTIGQHVLLGNIVVGETDATTYFGGSDDTFHPQLVWWSGTDNELLFSDEVLNPDANTGYQWLLSTPGPITAMKSVGENEVVIFKPHGIELMSLTGGDALFSFQTISTTIGTLSPQSVVVVGRDVYFVDSSGRFKVILNLSQVEDLGPGSMETFMSGTYIQANLEALGWKSYYESSTECDTNGSSSPIEFVTGDDWEGPLSSERPNPFAQKGIFDGTYVTDDILLPSPDSRVVGMNLRHVAGSYSYPSGSVVWSIRPVISTMGARVGLFFSPVVFIVYSIQHRSFSCIFDVASATDFQSPILAPGVPTGTWDGFGDAYELQVPLASYSRYEGNLFALEESGVLYSVRRTLDGYGLEESYNIDDIWGGNAANWPTGVILLTKKISFGESPIMPIPARIHSIRIVSDVSDKFDQTGATSQAGLYNLSVYLKSYDGKTGNPTWKKLGADETANGWFTVPRGGGSGYQFQIMVTASRPAANGPHILGFDIQYSVGGERA